MCSSLTNFQIYYLSNSACSKKPLGKLGFKVFVLCFVNNAILLKHLRSLWSAYKTSFHQCTIYYRVSLYIYFKRIFFLVIQRRTHRQEQPDVNKCIKCTNVYIYKKILCACRESSAINDSTLGTEVINQQ